MLFAPLCDLGRGQAVGDRRRQEDSIALFPDGPDAGLLVLSDGMGGAAGGDVASQLIVTSIVRCFDSEHGLDRHDNPARVVRDGARIANKALRQAVREDSDLAGMGGTLVAVMLTEKGFMFFSMGDSPLWLVRDGRIRRLNSDHSIGGLLDAAVARGEITAEAAMARKDRNSITSVLMGEPIDQMRRDECVDLIPNREGDVLILASDGMETLSEPEVLALVLRPAESAQALADRLVAAVEAVGKPRQDNVSVIVARW